MYYSGRLLRALVGIAKQYQLLKMLGHEFIQTPKARAKEVEAGIKNLPLAEKIRALAIYRYYQEINKIEELKMKESKEVEKKYLKLEDPIIKAQNAIINGDKAISLEELKNKEKFLTEEEIKTVDTQLSARKIPEYWLKAMKNCDVLKEQISNNDEQALKHLHNIHVVDEDSSDNFEIVFTFTENPFFKNKELKKKFILKDDYPVRGEGTVIEWEQGKDLTKKEIKKKQKNKKTGQTRVINKVVDAESFFNFFGTVDTKEEVEDVEADEDELKKRERLEQDFEIGGMIVDECVPYSLEYYLGVKAEDDDDEFEEDDSEDGEDKGSDDEDADEPKKKSKSKGKDKGGKSAAAAAGSKQQPECKQQ